MVTLRSASLLSASVSAICLQHSDLTLAVDLITAFYDHRISPGKLASAEEEEEEVPCTFTIPTGTSSLKSGEIYEYKRNICVTVQK